MGEPAAGHAAAPQDEYIVLEEATRGTETSKYPEEEKSTEIPLVVASERGPRANRRLRKRRRGCGAGQHGSYKTSLKRNGLGRPAAQG